jgi:hypothetical protein
LIGTRGSRHVAGDDAQHLRCLSAGWGHAAAEPKTFRLQMIDVRWRPKDCGGSWRLYKQKQKWDAGGRTQSFLPILRELQTLAKLCQNESTQHFHQCMYIMSPLTTQITTLMITTQTAHLQDEIRKCEHQTVKISCLLGSSVPSPVETVGPLPKLHPPTARHHPNHWCPLLPDVDYTSPITVHIAALFIGCTSKGSKQRHS